MDGYWLCIPLYRSNYKVIDSVPTQAPLQGPWDKHKAMSD